MAALRHVATVIDCKHRTVQFVEHGIPLASIGEVHGWTVDLSNAKRTTDEEFAAMIEGGREPREGDVIVSRNATVGAAALVKNAERFCLGQDVSLVRCGNSLMPEFLNWLFRSSLVADQIAVESIGATFLRLNVDQIKSLLVPIPPLELQRATVNRLSSSVGAVDATLSAKQHVLDLLIEKRKAIIATAVTRGLDPKVKQRDSGVPWLGEIPAHWKLERARWLFRERDLRSTTGGEEMLSVSHLTGVTPRSEKDVNMFEAETNEGYKLCEPGDLVINTLWAWMGAMGVAPVKGMVSPAYNVYEPGPRLAPAYVDALVRLPVFAQEVTRYSKGVWSSRLRLYPEGFFEVYLPVPTQEEQCAIVEHIARQTAKLDAVRAATERTIALLKERRSALISAAVTGQLDAEAAA